MEQRNADLASSLKRWKEIEESKDALVDKVENFFNQREDGGKVVMPLKITQVRNLLRLAVETTSVKEIRLFIRYQCARDPKARGWRSGNFGDSLIRLLAEVETMGRNNPGIEMARLFLGYFYRESYCRRPDETEGGERRER